MKVERILVLAPTPFFSDRGCHTHIAEQALALQHQGLKVEIVTYHLGRDLPELKTHRTLNIPWYTKTGPGPTWHKFYVDPLLLLLALKVARKFKPNVIHAHLHEGCLIGKAVSVLLDIPLVFDMQGSLTGELIAHNFALARPQGLRSLWYALEHWIDHLPQALVAQSTEMREELINRFDVPEEKIVMAYDGVNTQVFKPGQKDEDLLKKYGIPPHKKIIVYLGGLSSHKGVDILLSAFPQVLSEVPSAHLLLMGYPNEDRYRQRVKDMKLTESVTITGRIPYEQAPRYLALGDLAVAPKRSQTEANGKIYNYMAMGLPTVAFDTIVNRDILGDLGIYVSGLNDTAGLAQKISKLLKNDTERRRIGEEVRSRAVRDYSWDKVAQRLIRAYKHALTSSYNTNHA